MRIAFEAPIGNTSFALSRSDFVFAIAPMLKDLTYATYVKEAREEGKELWIDNGVYEGQLMELDEYLDLCYAWKPNVVVAPDVLGDVGQTVLLTKEFFDRLPTPRPFKVMFVPQGKDAERKGRGMRYLLKEGYPYDILGLGLAAFLKSWRARIFFFGHELFYSDLMHQYSLSLHILGIANYADLCFWSRLAGSCDTSLPFHLAQENRGLPYAKKDTAHIDWTDTLDGLRLRLAVGNVNIIRNMLDG